MAIYRDDTTPTAYDADGNPVYKPPAWNPGGDDGVYDPTWWVPPEDNTNAKPKIPGASAQTAEPAATSSGSSGYSSGYGGSGGSGGGSAAKPDPEPYIEEYRLKFFPGGRPPKDLLKQALKNNWGLEYFDQRVRLKDPNYYKSVEAKTLLPNFERIMKIMFPGLAAKKNLMKSAFYRQAALWYLKNGVGTREGGEDILYKYVTSKKLWNKVNPYYKDLVKNPNPLVQAEVNPVAYKQYLDAVQNEFTKVGIANLPQDYLRTFFQSRYASESGFNELQQNLKQYAATGGSLGWWQGAPMQAEQVKQATLGSGEAGTDLRAKMLRVFGVQKSYLGKDEQGPGAQLSKRGQLVTPLV